MYTVHILIYNIYIYCISAVVTAILDLNCPLVSWRVIHLSQFISGHYFCTSVCGGPGGGGQGGQKNLWLYRALEMEGHQEIVKRS